MFGKLLNIRCCKWQIFFKNLAIVAGLFEIIFLYFSVFDLALLSQADHAIMTYGTFALWGTLLSGDGLFLLPKSHKRGDVSLDIENAKMDRFIFI